MIIMMVVMMIMMITIFMMMMMMMIHLDLLKDDGEPAGHTLVPPEPRSDHHTLHTGQPHLVFGMLYLVFKMVYLVFEYEVFGIWHRYQPKHHKYNIRTDQPYLGSELIE